MGNMPVILSKAFVDMVLLVHFECILLLGIAADIAQEQIGVGIAARNRVTGVGKEQLPIHALPRLRDFVFMGIHHINAKLQIVVGNDFGEVVAIRESGVRVKRPLRNIARIFRE